MGFYSDTVVPRLVTCACGTKPILKQREKVVPLAQGKVLEIGMYGIVLEELMQGRIVM